MSFFWKSFATRGIGISFRTTSNRVNPDVRVYNSTSFKVSNVVIASLVVGFTGLGLEHFGSYVKKDDNNPPPPPSDGANDPVLNTSYVLLFSNLTSNGIDASKVVQEMMSNRSLYNWQNDNLRVEAEFTMLNELNCDQFNALFCFRAQKLPSPTVNYTERTLLMLDRKYGTSGGPLYKLLSDTLGATSQGDPTGTSTDGPIEKQWATGLFNRLTTGGPNGSMAGKIAVNFMDTVPVASGQTAAFDFSGQTGLADPPQNPLVKILKDAVTSAAQSAAQGLADYLKTLKTPSTSADTPDDRQTATVVKGIKDSMPSTGKTVAQLAVFNALGDPNMAKLDRDQQLRVAYTVANSTRAAVESVGNHVADLYQTNSLPTEEELAAIGARGLLDFLKSVGTTVVNGVMQAAPVVLNAVVNSASANNALGDALPPSVALSRAGLHELDTPTKITLASRIVNGTPNPQASVVTDKAVMDLADRQSNLGAQATLDTFTNVKGSSAWRDDDPPQDLRNKFRDVALAVANISPTFSNVTDIGATNLVTDTSLKHADSLRQNTLEMGIRSCANMIADHKSAEMLYQVHLYRLKIGAEVHPRSFLDFVKTAVPIAANIAKAAAPALLALL